MNYLLRSFSVSEGKWVDESSVGTGHRKTVYMFYPVYAICWPLIALGRYRDFTEANNAYC